MNKIFTLLVMGMLCLAVNRSFAQVNESFTQSLPSCWNRVNADPINLNNNGKIAFTNNGEATLGTPYITINNGSLDISFNYQLSDKQNGNKKRTIQVGYQAKEGSFTPLSGIIGVSTTNITPFKVNNSNSFSIPNGIYRIVIKGSGDGSNEKVLIDDLKVSGGTFHYGASPCNTAPELQSDNYIITGYGPHDEKRSVLANDRDANGEILKAYLETPSPDGTVLMNEDGTFVFKPHPGFNGESTQFTYRATDNGYDPEYRIATVFIRFVEAVTLPVKLINFSGNLVNQKAQLTWQVAENETGNHFEVQKSNDGKNFVAQTVVFCSAKTGTEAYQFTDAAFTSDKAYYRLKTVNKDGSVSYSKVLYLSSQKTESNNTINLLQNPVQSMLTFAFTAAANEETEIAIYNMAGIKLHTQKIKALQGTNQISIDTNANWNTGTYVLTVRSATAQRVTRFVK